MNIRILPFTPDLVPKVKEFNRRMMAGGLKADLAFPESPVLEFPTRGAPIWQEPFVATDGDEVRGAYYLTHERYIVRGEVCWIANYRHPISEVVINKAYRGLGSLLLSDARQRQPLLYSVGFGSEGNPNLRRLCAEGWSYLAIPFWFLVVRPAPFFAQLAFFRRTALRRLLFDLAANTGAGWIGVKTLQTMKALRGLGVTPAVVEKVSEFGPWSDDVWACNDACYAIAAVRDSATLNLRYPACNHRFTCLRVSDAKQVVGWVVLLDKKMKHNAYFGDMHVGTIVDCLAAPGREPVVVRAAVNALQAAGVDIIVSNQSAAPWCRALGRSGFLSGPSNYYLAFASELAQKVSLQDDASRFHVNRGDGAGISRL